MKRLYITLAACILMAFLIPFAPVLALRPVCGGISVTSHFLYMFAHASLLHWLVNTWSFLVLHNVLRWYRLLVAYLLAVAISFVPATVPAGSPAGVIGASVITTFFFGFIAPYYWHRNKSIPLMMAALIVIGCFLPNIAAAFHAVPFIVGIAYWYIERTLRSIRAYLN